MKVNVFSKSFLTLFATLSAAHIVEDMVWALLARYTTIPLLILVIGIVAWSFATAILVKIWGKKPKNEN